MCKATILISSILFDDVVPLCSFKFILLILYSGQASSGPQQSPKGLPLCFTRWTKATLMRLILMTGKHLFLNIGLAE